jgi:hypothetical protein
MRQLKILHLRLSNPKDFIEAIEMQNILHLCAAELSGWHVPFLNPHLNSTRIHSPC